MAYYKLCKGLMKYHFIVIGGGAAGFFAALSSKYHNPQLPVLILEKTNQLLSKVRISGGGRCNVTHACFDPVALSKNYPRGGKALIGPFSRFQPRDTMQWFESREVGLKIENDGRIFPTTDSSQTIIDCLTIEAKRTGVEIRLKQTIERIERSAHGFDLILSTGETLKTDRIVLATGNHPQGHAFARSFGHTIQEPVPSLFTLNIPASPLKDLAGISVPDAVVKIIQTSLSQQGPLLITHWGFSGPAVLRLSAWGARHFHQANYQVGVSINWIPAQTMESALELLKTTRKENPKQNLITLNPFGLPKNLWKRFVLLSGLEHRLHLSDCSNSDLISLCQRLTADSYEVEGKTTNKEEFVTCGGVTLDEVHFKTMESRLCPGLHFAGEILDIDGITGGFNFQNAWTTGWLAGQQ